MAKVFISYRRADSGPYTGRIYDRLVSKLGRKNVFKDVDDIPPGVNFPDYIQESLRQCAAMLVVIGPRWLDARGSDGARRLDDPSDFVRLEIETAIRLGLAVIPILLEGAGMPTAAELPESLRPLAFINAVVVRDDPDFGRDMERVLAGIERTIAARPSAAGRFGRRGGAAHTSPSSDAASVDTAIPTTPASSDAAPAEQPSRTRGTPRLTALPPLPQRARRPLLAGLAALLVVTSLAVLLSAHQDLFLVLVGQEHPTPTATTATTPTATKTLIPTATPLFSRAYRASEPGPGCDTGAAQWRDPIDSGQSGIMCLPQMAGTRMVGIQQSCGSTTCYSNEVTLDSSPQAQFPATAKVKLTIANLQGSDSSQASLGIRVEPSGSNLEVLYGFQIIASGSQWSIYRLENGHLAEVVTPRNTSAGAHTVAFTISGNTVGFNFDGANYPPYQEPAVVTIAEAEFSVGAYDAKPQADFSNFELDPLA